MLTALEDNDTFQRFVGQTSPVDANIPICLQRSADANEEKDGDSSEEDHEGYQAPHKISHFPRIRDPHQEQADCDFREHQRDECLNPIGPTDHTDDPALRVGKII